MTLIKRCLPPYLSRQSQHLRVLVILLRTMLLAGCGSTMHSQSSIGNRPENPVALSTDDSSSNQAAIRVYDPEANTPVSGTLVREAWAAKPLRVRAMSSFRRPRPWPIARPVVTRGTFTVRWSTTVIPGGILIQFYHHLTPSGAPSGKAFFWCAPVQSAPLQHGCRLGSVGTSHKAADKTRYRPYVDHAYWVFHVVSGEKQQKIAK